LIFRKAKKVARKPTKTAAASEATTPELEGLSFVSTGPGHGSGSGVYYIDFSDEYKTCLKRARDEVEKETQLSFLEKKEAKWADEISQDRNLSIEDRLLQLKVLTYMTYVLEVESFKLEKEVWVLIFKMLSLKNFCS
jgi:hypothetical protein